MSIIKLQMNKLLKPDQLELLILIMIMIQNNKIVKRNKQKKNKKHWII